MDSAINGSKEMIANTTEKTKDALSNVTNQTKNLASNMKLIIIPIVIGITKLREIWFCAFLKSQFLRNLNN